MSLGQTLAFDVMKEGFVQVLHTGRGHWVSSLSLGVKIFRDSNITII